MKKRIFQMRRLCSQEPIAVVRKGTVPPESVFKVRPNEPTRWYIFNVGHNDGVAFHFIGTYQNDFYGSDPEPTPGHLRNQNLSELVNWISCTDGASIVIMRTYGMHINLN
jgi:hypothetical protein